MGWSIPVLHRTRLTMLSGLYTIHSRSSVSARPDTHTVSKRTCMLRVRDKSILSGYQDIHARNDEVWSAIILIQILSMNMPQVLHLFVQA